MIAPSILVSSGAFVLVAAVIGSLRDAAIPSSIVLIVLVLWRSYVWDEHGRPVHYTERRIVYDVPEVRELERPVAPTSSTSQLRVGRFSFTRSEWHRIGAVLLDRGKITREPLRDLQNDHGSPLFTNLNEVYGDFRDDLADLGWVDESGNVTEAARAWFADPGASSLPNRP